MFTHLTAIKTDERMGFTAGSKYPIVYSPIESGTVVLEDVYFIWVINDRMDSVNARLDRFEEEFQAKGVIDSARKKVKEQAGSVLDDDATFESNGNSFGD